MVSEISEKETLKDLMPDVLYILANNELEGDKTAGELAVRIRAALAREAEGTIVERRIK